jgi:hypothetical protein
MGNYRIFMHDDSERMWQKANVSYLNTITAHRSRQRHRFFPSPKRPDQLGHTKPPIQWVAGAHSLGIKGLGREVGHIPPYNTEVNNCGTIPPLPYQPSWRGGFIIASPKVVAFKLRGLKFKVNNTLCFIFAVTKI